MKKLIFIMVTFLILFSCGNANKARKQDFRMVTLIERYVNEYQLDSLCISDTLSQDVRDWYNAEFISYETGDTIQKYVWIKQWSCGTMFKYVITGKKEPFLLEKIMTSKIEK